jgi:hypothetical protein
MCAAHGTFKLILGIPTAPGSQEGWLLARVVT